LFNEDKFLIILLERRNDPRDVFIRFLIYRSSILYCVLAPKIIKYDDFALGNEKKFVFSVTQETKVRPSTFNLIKRKKKSIKRNNEIKKI